MCCRLLCIRTSSLYAAHCWCCNNVHRPPSSSFFSWRFDLDVRPSNASMMVLFKSKYIALLLLLSWERLLLLVTFLHQTLNLYIHRTLLWRLLNRSNTTHHAASFFPSAFMYYGIVQYVPQGYCFQFNQLLVHIRLKWDDGPCQGHFSKLSFTLCSSFTLRPCTEQIILLRV